MDLDQREMQKQAALLGLVFGLIMLVIGIIALYLIAGTTNIAVVFGSPALLSFLFPVLLAVFFTLRLRSKAGGYWSFREATSGIFLMFFVAYFVYSLGNLVHSRAIDPDINERVQKNIVQVTQDFASKQNVPTEEIDEKLEELERSMEEIKKPSVAEIAQGMIFSIILVFLVSLVFAAIFKKEASVFDQP